jgi:hypothetical protein
MKYPNLFIIGAMKAGTSSLHEYLHQHPQIFMSRFKEPQYFAPHTTRWGIKWGMGHPHPEPTMGWYLDLFAEAGDVKYAGESSVSYTAAPWISDCHRRIHAFNPDARLIYLLRDPIERTISHYWHFVADGREDREMLTAIRRNEDYVSRSNYARQIRPYLTTFGQEQVFVLTLEELTAAPGATFRRLFAWLEVDPDYPIATEQKFNVGSPRLWQTRRGLVLLDTLQKSWRWKKQSSRVPQPVRRLLQQLTYRSIDRAVVDTRHVIDYLRPIQQRQVEELSALLGRQFLEWTTLAPNSCSEQAAEYAVQPLGAATR